MLDRTLSRWGEARETLFESIIIVSTSTMTQKLKLRSIKIHRPNQETKERLRPRSSIHQRDRRLELRGGPSGGKKEDGDGHG